MSGRQHGNAARKVCACATADTVPAADPATDTVMVTYGVSERRLGRSGIQNGNGAQNVGTEATTDTDTDTPSVSLWKFGSSWNRYGNFALNVSTGSAADTGSAAEPDAVTLSISQSTSNFFTINIISLSVFMKRHISYDGNAKCT